MVKNLHFMLVPILWAFVPITKINAEYEVSKYCQLVPVGTKLPSLESCQTFYTCLGQKQVAESKCAGDDVFDKDLQMCVPRTNNNCHVNIGNPCENQDDTWVGDTKDCSLWHYCSSGKLIGSGSCALGQYFDDTIKSCVNGKCPYNMETSGEINDLCQIMQKDQFFGDFQDCAVWHRCNGSGMNKGKCEHGLLYDTQKRMCLKDNDQLCEHNGGKLPLVTQGLEGKNCIENKAKIADVRVCSMYYECQETKWKMFTCSTNQYFDIISEKCEDRQIAKPAKGCNRCQFTKTTWVNEVDAHCRAYNICKDGQTIASGWCQEYSYFNEELQYCLIDDMYFDKYRENNGACNNTTCSSVQCKIVECLADANKSLYECQLQVYVNERNLSPNICRAALCRDSESYPECKNNLVCDA